MAISHYRADIRFQNDTHEIRLDLTIKSNWAQASWWVDVHQIDANLKTSLRTILKWWCQTIVLHSYKWIVNWHSHSIKEPFFYSVERYFALIITRLVFEILFSFYPFLTLRNRRMSQCLVNSVPELVMFKNHCHSKCVPKVNEHGNMAYNPIIRGPVVQKPQVSWSKLASIDCRYPSQNNIIAPNIIYHLKIMINHII